MKFLQHLRVAKTLLMTDLKEFRPIVCNKIIDMVIWVTITLWVSTYILPKMGIQADYGLFMLGAMISSVSVFEAWPTIFALTHDFERGRVTHYYATLPLPTWMVFARLILFNALVCGFLSALVIPLAMPLMWSSIVWGSISWIKFGAMFVVANLFYGALGPFVTSWIKSSAQTRHAWMRLIFPLWFLGGFQFTWNALYATTPWFATVSLINPILHITEGYRTALTGIHSFPFWGSFCYLAVATGVISWIAIVRLKKRLDFI